MELKQDLTHFVAIGGLGGSGTRVVAEVVQKLGFHLGPVLNKSLDNQLFNLLFRRRDWFESFPTDANIDRMIEVFAMAMRDGVDQAFERLEPDEIGQIYENSHKLIVSPSTLQAILASPPPKLENVRALAWKEPNTHVFLPRLAQRLPNMKYIHVIRNGLDMALSGNRKQLENWGGHFGIQTAAGGSPSQTQLRFWLATNRRATEFGTSMTSERFLLLNYDNLCTSFESEATRLQAFLNRQLSGADMVYFSSHIGSDTIGRFREAPANTFSPAEREAVRQFGFCVD